MANLTRESIGGKCKAWLVLEGGVPCGVLVGDPKLTTEDVLSIANRTWEGCSIIAIDAGVFPLDQNKSNDIHYYSPFGLEYELDENEEMISSISAIQIR